ncbi:MAG: hypothetical protein ACK4F6_01165 [Hylemonella sp.]
MKTFVMISLAILASISTTASAQGLPLQTTTGAEIGIQVSSYRYEEDRNGSFLMSLEGKKLGLTGSFTQAYGDNQYWGGDLRYASGNADYTSASTGEKSANPDSYVDARVTFGKDFDVGSQVLSPYTGLGYRYLNSDLRGYSTTGAAGYRRTSHYIYLPVGVTHRFRMGPDARFATTVEYDYLLQGMQRSYMTDLGYNSDLNNQQRNGHGLRLSLAYEAESWSAGVFYHYWNIADSDIGVYTSPSLVYAGYEPHNITREVGVQVKYRFR